MKTQHTSKQSIGKALAAALALTFISVVSVGHSAGTAYAQELTGQMGRLNSLGGEQDSLLPPEVIPIDPAIAARNSQVQANNTSRFDLTPDTANVPGLVPGYVPNTTGQDKYKQMQKAMNNSQYGQAPMPQFANANQINQINANVAGQNPYLVPMGTNPIPNQAAQDLANQNMVAVNAPVAQGPGFSQSQTLTGGSTIQQQRRDTRRGGFSNAFSSFPGLLSIPTSLLGGGIGFGGIARNGF